MAARDGDDDPTLRGDERILYRARSRLKRCLAYYGNAYKNSLEDDKFASADDRNKNQWPDIIFRERDGDGRPCLTINIVEPHNRLVINEAMQNRMSPRVRAVGGKASAEAAEGMQALVDRTENISAAMLAYRKMIRDQITGGFGYLLLDTKFVSAKSFDQDVYIRAARDPRAIFLDFDVKEPDGSDAQFGFEVEQVARDRFNREHPKFKNKVGQSTLGMDPVWITDDYVLRVMYYEREQKNDQLVAFTKEDGSQFVGHRSELEAQAGPELVEQIFDQIDSGTLDGRYRDVITEDVNWYLIGGDQIIKRGDKPETRWIGKYIPIIPCYGVMTIINGKMDCKGHTRAQISAQQMLNYNASGQVQFGALQSKTPYIGPARAFEGNEEMWGNANRKNYAFLPYEDWVADEGEDGGGRQVASPTRQEPPQTAPVFAQGMQDAERWNMMVTGQWQESQGQGNPTGPESGRAVRLRQRQGNIATQHFTEHQNDAYRYLGKQLIDIYPKLYDTKRVLHAEGEDLSKRQITIDPDAMEAFQRIKKEADTAEEIIFNPTVGEYEVLSDPGPNYATQRQETFDAITDLMAQNQQLAGIIGDIYLKNGDFAGAQEMAERVKKVIKAEKPYLFDDTAEPQVVQMQQQLQALTNLNADLMQKLADLQLRLRGKDEKRDVDASNAETKRLEVIVRALEKLGLPEGERIRMEHELGLRTHDAALDIIRANNEAAIRREESETLQ